MALTWHVCVDCGFRVQRDGAKAGGKCTNCGMNVLNVETVTLTSGWKV